MSEYRDVDIKWEWLAAPNVRAAELRATWARLEIHIGAECLTLVEDKDSGSSRRSIYCPLYPLAEWIAFNWWFLAAHTRPASILSRTGSYLGSAPESHLRRQRHNVRGAGDGFLWPNLFVLPEGETTRLVWRADEPHSDDKVVRFLTSGEATVESAALRQHLINFVERVIARLAEQGVGDTPLVTEWTAIQSTDEEEAQFCLASARLGLDPYSEAEKYESDILRAAHELDKQLFDDFMDVVQPGKISITLDWVAAAQEEIRVLTDAGDEAIDALRSKLRFPSEWTRLRPWERGWAQARLVRELVDVDLDQPFQPRDMIRTSVRAVPTRGLQALGGKNPGAPGVVVIGDQQPEGAKRFTLARALWHLLWEGSSPFLVTSAYTDRQKIERAFAAELLAPASGIAKRLSVDSISMGVEERELEELARHFQVSPMLVQHQLENQVLR